MLGRNDLENWAHAVEMTLEKKPTQEVDWENIFASFSKLKPKTEIINSQCCVPILTENYRPYWLFCVNTSILDFLIWSLGYTRISTMPKTGSKPSRFKNEKCNLVLVPGPQIDSLKTQSTDDPSTILKNLLKEVQQDTNILTQAKFLSSPQDEINEQTAEYVIHLHIAARVNADVV